MSKVHAISPFTIVSLMAKPQKILDVYSNVVFIQTYLVSLIMDNYGQFTDTQRYPTLSLHGRPTCGPPSRQPYPG